MAVTITVVRPHQCGHHAKRHAGLACLAVDHGGLYLCEVETAHDLHIARDGRGRIVRTWTDREVTR